MFMQKYTSYFVCEFFCTMSLVAFMCLACSMLEDSMLALSIVYGLLQLVLIRMCRHISGAHANPAISLALWVRGRMSFKRLLLYVTAQMAGGAVGHFGANSVLGKLPSDTLCTFVPSAELSNARIMGIEFWLTFLMVTMWCILWDYKGKLSTELYLASINVLVCLLGGHLTGASTNPARALAPVFFTHSSNRIYFLVAGQFLAGIAAPWLWGVLDK